VIEASVPAMPVAVPSCSFRAQPVSRALPNRPAANNAACQFAAWNITVESRARIFISASGLKDFAKNGRVIAAGQSSTLTNGQPACLPLCHRLPRQGLDRRQFYTTKRKTKGCFFLPPSKEQVPFHPLGASLGHAAARGIKQWRRMRFGGARRCDSG
jgi:hypothetical protein